jgi:hypothetical protein
MCHSLRKYTFLAMTAAGTLLLQGCAGLGHGAASTSEYGAAGAEEEQEARNSSPKRSQRRARSSLSMPYFSFAQPLTPRS